MNTGERYGWAALSQWDITPANAYIEHKLIETALSKESCRFILVNRIDQGGGYLRCEYIEKKDVTPEILQDAGQL